MKKGFHLCPWCFFCGEEAAIVNHNIHCRITSQLWRIFINMKCLTWIMTGRIVEVLEIWNSYGSLSVIDGELYLLALGGECGEKGTLDVLRISANLLRK